MIWEKALGPMLAPAMVAGPLVFVSTRDRETFALRAADGKIVWRHEKGLYSPGIVTDRHYYMSLGSTLIAYRGENSPRSN